LLHLLWGFGPEAFASFRDFPQRVKPLGCGLIRWRRVLTQSLQPL